MLLIEHHQVLTSEQQCLIIAVNATWLNVTQIDIFDVFFQCSTVTVKL